MFSSSAAFTVQAKAAKSAADSEDNRMANGFGLPAQLWLGEGKKEKQNWTMGSTRAMPVVSGDRQGVGRKACSSDDGRVSSVHAWAGRLGLLYSHCRCVSC